MMTFNEGDRVRMIAAPEQRGTVTADVHKDFPMMTGVRWDYSGDFGFLRPALIELATPAAVPRMSAADGAALDHAQRLASAALTRLEDEVGIRFAGHHNRTESGTEVVDWQTRAEQAEAKVAAVEALADKWESSAGPGSRHEGVFGKQVVSVKFAVNHIRAAMDDPDA